MLENFRKRWWLKIAAWMPWVGVVASQIDQGIDQSENERVQGELRNLYSDLNQRKLNWDFPNSERFSEASRRALLALQHAETTRKQEFVSAALENTTKIERGSMRLDYAPLLFRILDQATEVELDMLLCLRNIRGGGQINDFQLANQINQAHADVQIMMFGLQQLGLITNGGTLYMGNGKTAFYWQLSAIGRALLELDFTPKPAPSYRKPV